MHSGGLVEVEEISRNGTQRQNDRFSLVYDLGAQELKPLPTRDRACDETTRTLVFSAQLSKIFVTSAGCAMDNSSSPRKLAGRYAAQQVLEAWVGRVCRADEAVMKWDSAQSVQSTGSRDLRG